jgi:ribonuclease T2
MRLLLALFAALMLCDSASRAQEKGTPGKFDFYLLDVAYGPDFCNVPGIGQPCKQPSGFVLHGLWPQNNDGTYPVFCAEKPGLMNYESALKYTPNLELVKHEWDKHGSCTGLSASQYFISAHMAYHSFQIPAELTHVTEAVDTTADHILDLFRAANPSYPANSLVVGCSKGVFTSVAACLGKDLNPIACQKVALCRSATLKIVPSDTAIQR